jgi:hypothetical protein
MSLQSLAKTLQDQGRGNDSVLVHMTPKEVHGLQSLALAHGGSLTINPTTGLAEAGFLEDLLPSVVGIGANLLFPGLGALGTGLATGLTSYALNRDPSRALMSGALSGGLSGLMGGVEEAGANALGNTSEATGLGRDLITQRSAITPETFGSMPSDLPVSLSNPPSGFTGPPNLASPEEAYRKALDVDSLYPTAEAPTLAPASAPAPAGTPDIPNTPGYYNTNAPSYGDKISEGLKSVAKNPIDFIKAHPYATAATGLGLAGMMAPGQTAAPGPQAKTGNAPRFTWNPQTRKYETAPAMPYTYYAGGGEIPGTYPQAHIQDKTDFYAQSTATPMSTPVVTDYDARINPQGDVVRAAAGGGIDTEIYGGGDKGPYTSKKSKQAQADLELIKYIQQLASQANYAQGGIASLNEYAAGGKLLKGPGDGMSDSIPAVIKGAKPQRAALAQGEFVVPADVVSHLGNGSTDAGAKRLYAMMDKVRMARTGNKKQGRQINPAKFMPA